MPHALQDPLWGLIETIQDLVWLALSGIQCLQWNPSRLKEFSSSLRIDRQNGLQGWAVSRNLVAYSPDIPYVVLLVAVVWARQTSSDLDLTLCELINLKFWGR